MLHLCSSSLPGLLRKTPTSCQSPKEAPQSTGRQDESAHLDVNLGFKSAILFRKSLAKKPQGNTLTRINDPTSNSDIHFSCLSTACTYFLHWGGNDGKVIKLCNGVLLDGMKMQNFLFTFVNE